MTSTDSTPLTDRQREVLVFVVMHFGVHLRPPTVRQIATAFRFSGTNGAAGFLKALVRKGRLKKEGRSYMLPAIAAAVRQAAQDYADRLGCE